VLLENKQRFKLGVVMTEHHMTFWLCFLVLLFTFEDK
jgi:hypothetical protein